ncbi:hypothetical protein [Sphingomonas sp. HMP6]|nr:hypothetical protein [Sphingomonas sp. HMP6]
MSAIRVGAHAAVPALRETLSTMAARLVDGIPRVAAIAQPRQKGFSHAA